MLKEILSRNGITVPSRASGISPLATVSVRDQPGRGQYLQVTMPEMIEAAFNFNSYPSPFATSMATSSPGSGETAVPHTAESQGQQSEFSGSSTFASPAMSEATHQPQFAHPAQIMEVDQDFPARTSHNILAPPTQQQVHASHLDTPQIGIDFVLSLEQPCLGHTRGDESSDNPSCHALTAQAPLLTAAPASLSSTSTWQIPAVEIERLLDLSSQLDLQGEVTPVQAWSRIKNYPGFGKLGPDRLEGLKFALMAEVECCG